MSLAKRVEDATRRGMKRYHCDRPAPDSWVLAEQWRPGDITQAAELRISMYTDLADVRRILASVVTQGRTVHLMPRDWLLLDPWSDDLFVCPDARFRALYREVGPAA